MSTAKQEPQSALSLAVMSRQPQLKPKAAPGVMCEYEVYQTPVSLLLMKTPDFVVRSDMNQQSVVRHIAVKCWRARGEKAAFAVRVPSTNRVGYYRTMHREKTPHQFNERINVPNRRRTCSTITRAEAEQMSIDYIKKQTIDNQSALQAYEARRLASHHSS